jgi:hypothetical protein
MHVFVIEVELRACVRRGECVVRVCEHLLVYCVILKKKFSTMMACQSGYDW